MVCHFLVDRLKHTSIPNWTRLSIALATSLVFALSAIAEQKTRTDKQAPAYDGPSMVAELVNHNTKREVPRVVNRVLISRDGFRMESDPRDGQTRPNLMIQNFKTRKFWLVDQDRRMFVEIPDEPTAQSDTQTVNDYETGIMTTKVCGDLPKRAQGPAAWRGNKVTVWLCMRGTLNGIRQFYSPYWKLVVREEHADGRVSELRNIKRTALKPTSFQPPAGFRGTDINEFMGAPEALDAYEPDTAPAQTGSSESRQ